MTAEIREELIKWMHDTPALGAIILTKMHNPDPVDFGWFEKWVYNHGWFWLIIYRFGVIIYDIDKKLRQPVMMFVDGKVEQVSGYYKIYYTITHLLK